VITLLLLAVLALLAVRSNDRQFWPLCVFTLPAILFHCFAPFFPEWHFHVASVLDVIVLYGLFRLIDTDQRLVAGLALTSVVSVLLNIVGWIAYEAYLPPDRYNAAFIFLYTLVIVLVVGNGYFNTGRKGGRFPRHFSLGRQFIFKDLE